MKNAQTTIVRCGNGCVDPASNMIDRMMVYEARGIVWSCMLNLTDITYGLKGHNKFYSFQLLIDRKTLSETFVFFRWGRVGSPNPPTSVKGPMSLHEAQLVFQSKFKLKTENDWPLSTAFEHVEGKYRLVDIDYTNRSLGNRTTTTTSKSNKKQVRLWLFRPMHINMDMTIFTFDVIFLDKYSYSFIYLYSYNIFKYS